MWTNPLSPKAWHRDLDEPKIIDCPDPSLIGQSFASVAEEGTSSWDTLALFHAPRLAGPWTAHPANPVLVDAATARPAGMMFTRDGALLRPAQDCTAGYGSALTLCRVDRLDRDGYAQTLAARLVARPDWPREGVHTLNAAGGLEVIDCCGWRSRRAEAGGS